MLAATVDGLRVVSLYAPNGRVVGSPFYAGKLAWFERLARWVRETTAPGGPARAGRRSQRRPDRRRRLGCRRPSTAGTHVSEPERAAFRALLDLGLTDGYRARHDETGRFSWWDYRAGMFHKNFGMRIDHLLASAPVAARIVDAEIDRDARKGPPVPSDHAPLASTSTSRAARSTPTGRARSPGSRQGPSRGAEGAPGRAEPPGGFPVEWFQASEIIPHSWNYPKCPPASARSAAGIGRPARRRSDRPLNPSGRLRSCGVGSSP